MWWRLIVLVLSIVVIIIIIILQQFDDVNALYRQYLPDLRNFFSKHSLMDYPVKFRKSANLHIQDGRHGLICISDIDDRRKRSPVPNIHTIFAIFSLNTL